MPTATMTTVDALTKEVYEPRLESQLQDETTGYKRIERSSDGVVETVGGKYVDFPIRVRRNPGLGYRNENEQLQDPDRSGYAEVHVGLKYGYGRTRLTGQVMQLAERNFQAFASAMDEEMEGLKNDIQKDSNRIVYGDASGLLAKVTADGVNTVTVDNVQYLEMGMRIDIANRTTGTIVGTANRAITAINEDTKVVTYDGADLTAATTDGIYRTGNYNREPHGLGSLVSGSGTIFGVNPTTEPKWKATEVANGGTNRALSEGLMIETVDKIRRQSGKTITLILCGLGVRRAYFNLLTQQRRYTDTKEFAGGFTGLAFNYGKEVPVVEDLDAPPNLMYFLTESTFKIYRNKPWHFAQDDGSIWKWVRDFDAWEVLNRCYWELGLHQRNANGVLKDITEG